VTGVRLGYALAFACHARDPIKMALILPAWVSSCAAVLLRGSIPSCLRAPVPPEARSWPFPARLADAAAIWCRRPNACTLARTRGILWGMRPWRALRGGQAGARPVSQPPAPACELPVISSRYHTGDGCDSRVAMSGAGATLTLKERARPHPAATVFSSATETGTIL